MFLFVQFLFDSSLSIFSLAIQLSMLGHSTGINSRFIFLSYFVRCFLRNLIGPLSRVACIIGCYGQSAHEARGANFLVLAINNKEIRLCRCWQRFE